MAKKDNSFAEALNETGKTIRDMWRHRKGLQFMNKRIEQVKIPLIKKVIYLEHDIPGTILDVIDALYPEDKPRPLLTSKNHSEAGWHMVFALPAGLKFSDFQKQQEYFSTACRCYVNIENIGGYAHLTVYDGKIETYYPYKWDPTPYLGKMDLPIPIGYSSTGLEVVDLAALPHMRVGGTTFTGKSNFLHNVFISLAMLPNVLLAVIDLALLEFSYTQDYAAFAADTMSALRLLQSLEREMHRRRKLLNAARVAKIQEYEGEDLPFIVLLVDEFAFMNPDSTPDKKEKELRKECQTICANLAALARKVGIHLIFAMQRPDMKILPGQLKANLPGAISFKTINAVNSEIILDNGAAAELPNIKGRAIWQVGNQQKEVQVMHLPIKKARKLLKQYRGGGKVGSWYSSTTKRLPPR